MTTRASFPPGQFLLGMNYPWVNYGQDFGRSPWGANGVSSPPTRAIVSADFAAIADLGVKLVRWFLLCDGRSGLSVANGIPTGPDDLLFADVAAALAPLQRLGPTSTPPDADPWWQYHLASGRDATDLMRALRAATPSGAVSRQ